MNVSFLDAWCLLLLLLLPCAVIVVLKSRSGLDRARIIASTVIRLAIMACLILAVAETQRVEEIDRLATIFVIDLSKSVPPEGIRKAQEFIASALAYKKSDDLAAVITFGGNAQVEIAPSSEVRMPKLGSIVDQNSTDIASALRLAAASIPDGYQKRIVLFSDGNENIGSALDDVRNAASGGCRVDIVPLSYSRENEVLVERVQTPQTVNIGETFDLHIVVKSLQETNARIRVFQDGSLIASEDVKLEKGKNPLKISRASQTGGMSVFEAIVEPEHDTLPENNRGYSFTFVGGAANVLYIGDDDESARFVKEILQTEKIGVEVRSPDSIPRDIAEFGMYDCVILSNVAANKFSSDQMKYIETCVKDVGIGLVMIGGKESFGAGGYNGTPIEDALPVKMDISQNLIRPNSGVVFIVDSIWCIGNSWPKEICKATTGNLSANDFVGLIANESSVTRWTIPLQEVKDQRANIQTAIERLNPLDISDFDMTLNMALAELPKAPASYKHIVLITDGRPSPPPSDAIISRLNEAKITLTIVVIEPRVPVERFQEAARKGGGNFYVVQPSEHTKIPEIITKESNVVRKGLFFEEPFTPKTVKLFEFLKGIGLDQMPPLKGYNATSPKNSAWVSMISHHGDPILAAWRYGLGKSVAFTSDCANRWAVQWVGWKDFKKFWSQTIRWTLREGSRTIYNVSGAVQGRMGKFVIDAVEPDGGYANNINPAGSVVRPNNSSQPILFEQIAPGRYSASFPMDAPGKYLAAFSYTTKEGQKGFFTGGLALPYSPEYGDIESNDLLLKDIATASGGRELTKSEEPFVHDLPRSWNKNDLWQSLLLVALLLFPLDIFIRRVVVTREQIAAILSNILTALPFLKRIGERMRERIERKNAPVPVHIDVASIATAESDGKYEGAETMGERTEIKSAVVSTPRVEHAAASGAPTARKEDDSYLGRLLRAKKSARKNL